MQNGDLSASAVARMVAVLEGVLIDVDEVHAKGRFGKDKVTTDWHWLDLPLKNLVSIKRRFPEAAVDIVTFLGDEAAERANGFLNRYGLDDFNEVYAADFKDWCWALPFRPDIVTVYDSDPDRLDHYGQRGYAVVKGSTF